MTSRLLATLGQYPRVVRSGLTVAVAVTADSLINTYVAQDDLPQFSLVRPVHA